MREAKKKQQFKKARYKEWQKKRSEAKTKKEPLIGILKNFGAYWMEVNKGKY